MKAGPGPEVTEAEELDRVIPAIEALHARFDVAISVDTWRASVARAAYKAGAVMGNDISGFADPDYLAAAAEAGAAVVATHIRWPRGSAIPNPSTTTSSRRCGRSWSTGPARALAAGIGPDRIVLDAGLDLGKTAEQSLTLLRGSDVLARLGYPLLLSASNKTFWVRSSASTSTSGGRRRWPRRRWAWLSGAGSSAFTTWRAPRVVCDSLAAVLEAA